MSAFRMHTTSLYFVVLFFSPITTFSAEDGTCSVADGCPDEEGRLDVLITFKNVGNNKDLQTKFGITVRSLLETSSVPVTFYLIGDDSDNAIAQEILTVQTKGLSVPSYKVSPLDAADIAKKLHTIVKPMQIHFSKSQSYYSDSLFFLSIGIHRILPPELTKVIMIDADLKFLTDIKQLFNLFDKFSESQIIGIARENQPVYRHTFYVHRRQNSETRVGDPPPDGITGFNSGVMLLNLEAMRQSELYNSMMTEESLDKLTQKYQFQGHLGDQDFFTLLSIDYPELFYVLPCGWNRQLCRWWHGKGYDDVFDLFYNCDGNIHILHGNCKTPIPGEKYH